MAPHVVLLFALALQVQSGATDGSGTLTGVVRDQQGGAISGAAVTVTCGDVVHRARTSRSGEFEVKGLRQGRCRAEAVAPLFEPESLPLDIGGERTSVTLTLPLMPYATEVVVTPGRGLEEDGFSVPETVSTVSRESIKSRPYHLLAQVLREEPGILVQQTTSGQVSPIIRGFTGQSNVYLVDGVRLNTAAWRSGPSQYFGWVDSLVANRIEIVRGPGSVQYGSDALGGTINVLSAPTLFPVGDIRFGGEAQVTAGTADRSAGGEASLHLQAGRGSLRIGGSRRSIGDLRGGEGIDSRSALTRFLGLPSTILGARMRATGYDQSGGVVSGGLELGGATLSGLYVHSDQEGASRYDRLLGGAGNYRSGFDPQRLDFGFLRYLRPDVAGLDGVSATFSVNRQADGRFEQARPTARLDAQQAVTRVFGYQVQGHRAIRGHQLLAGGELYDEHIDASRQFRDATGVSAQRPDIPDGTAYRSLGFFAQHSMDMFKGRLNMRSGARYGRFAFSTTANELLGVTAEEVTTDALTFQVGTVVSVNEHFNVVGRVSRGFRAANAADLGDIGLTGGGGFVITPSRAAALNGFVGSSVSASAVSTGERVGGLSPEVLYSYEAGVKFRSRRVGVTATVYDLEYLDTIQRAAVVFASDVVGTTISGFEIVRQEAPGLAYIAQDVRPIATRVNGGQARIVGFDVQADARLAPQWTAAAYFSLADGRLLSNSQPLRRMPPPIGGARVRWGARGFWAESVLGFARPQTRLNSGDLSDARIGALRTRASIASFFNGTATDLGLVQGGTLVATGENLAAVQNRLLGTATSGALYESTPGFVVFSLRGGVRVAEHIELALLGENLLDRNYRLHGSGVDSPGRDLQLRVRYTF